ncbi:MAG: hypothetical protein J6N19_03015 [Clostridium sp.]|nr:hypothetical protein [Clostridium sp.]
MTKTIRFSLDAHSIEKAIRELEEYRKDLLEKCERLRQLVAMEIGTSAEQGFRSAVVDDIFKGEWSTPNDVEVHVDEHDNVSVVIASGSQAVFIEFGSGVYHNGAAGSSPHKWGAENGFIIGEYGHKQGRKKGWNIRAGVATHGTPAQMPLYNAMEDVISRMTELVDEVFG